MASLQHLGGDTWRVRVPISRHPATGKRRSISRSFSAPNKTAAKKIERRITLGIETTEQTLRALDGTIGQLVDDWLSVKQRTLSPTTMRGYRARSKVIVGKFGSTQAAALTGRDIDRWYSALMDDGVTVAEIRHLHLVLRAVVRFGYRRGDIDTVPTDRATPPTYRQPENRPPTATVLRMLLDGLPTRSHSQWARAVRILARTGMRRGEVCGLRWDDIGSTHIVVRHSVIDVGNGVQVRTPKTHKSRTVALTPGVAAILTQQREFLDGRPTPWVFPDLRTDPSGALPRRPASLTLAWSKYRKMYGAERVRLHDLRHAYATIMIDEGVPVTTVSRLLGHAKTSTTTDIYGFGSDAGEQLAIDAESRVFDRESPAPVPPPE
jgi:integrase